MPLPVEELINIKTNWKLIIFKCEVNNFNNNDKILKLKKKFRIYSNELVY